MTVTIRPLANSPRPWQFPRYTTTLLEGRPVVASCDLPGKGMATAALLFSSGAAGELPAHAGARALAVEAALQATERLDAGALAYSLEQLGATLSSTVTWDAARLTVNVPVSNLAPALELLAEVVHAPAFAEADVTRVREERLTQLVREAGNPAAIADQQWRPTVYEIGSAYARDPAGDSTSVGALDRESLVCAFNRLITTSPVTLLVAGALDGFTPERLAARFSDLGAAHVSVAPDPEINPRRLPRHVTLIDFPDAPHSVVRVGHVGPPFLSDDPPALEALALGLGGQFTSRINLKLREERGFTYGARASFDRYRQGGFFTVATSVQVDATAVAISDILYEVERVHAEPFADEELDFIRSSGAGGFRTRFDAAGPVVDALCDLVIYDLEVDYYDRLAAELAEISKERIAETARQELHPEQLAILVVGDGSRVQAELEALGLTVSELDKGPMLQGT